MVDGKLVSERLAGSDRVVGTLLSEEYVRNWAKSQLKKEGGQALKNYLAGDDLYDKYIEKHGEDAETPNQFRVTDDVRAIIEETLQSSTQNKDKK